MTFADAIRADPDRVAGVEFIGVFIPGINTTDYAALAPKATVISTFVSPPFAKSFREGRLKFLPKAYSGMARHLSEIPPDIAVLHVSPPGPDGRMALGINQDYAPIAARGAKQIIALVNPRHAARAGRAGAAARGLRLLSSRSTSRCGPFRRRPHPARWRRSARMPRPSSATATRSRSASARCNRRCWRICSTAAISAYIQGMIDDAIAALAEKGVITNARKSIDRGVSVTGIAIGTEPALAFAQRPDVRFRDAFTTHGAGVLGAIDNFVAINSALEVDLFGQCNAEILGGRQVSGAGGFHDFLRGAGAIEGRTRHRRAAVLRWRDVAHRARAGVAVASRRVRATIATSSSRNMASRDCATCTSTHARRR